MVDDLVVAALFATFATFATLGLGACRKPEEPKPPETSTRHGCRASLSKASSLEPVAGTASGADKVVVLVESWRAACARLPEDQRTTCDTERAPDGWSSSAVDGSVVTDGKPMFTRTITLTPREQYFSATATSTISEADACALAFVDACKAAGRPAGCESTPGFTNHGSTRTSAAGRAK